MKLYTSLVLEFGKNGKAVFPNSSTINENTVSGISAPRLLKTKEGDDIVSDAIFNELRLTLKKNSVAIYDDVPLTLVEPTDLQKVIPLDVKGLDLKDCFVSYKGDEEITGKFVELVFELSVK